MQLVPVPDGNGQPVLWVNPEHIVSVTRLDYTTGMSVQLRAELKIEGMPLQRIDLGTHRTTQHADTAWTKFLTTLNPHPLGGQSQVGKENGGYGTCGVE